MPHLPPLHWTPIAIFVVTYLLIAVESNRSTYLDRTAAAFCGAVAMVLARVLTLDDAYHSIDWNTIVFLLGIMILVAHFAVSGFFDWIAVHIAALARNRLQLLALLVATSGILSAFFVNDTVCLMFAPIVLSVTSRLKLPPRPYLIALATSANVGSAMSITGNPQNALIGIAGKFSFLGFLGRLAPVSIVGLALNFALLALIFRRDLAGGALPSAPARPVALDRVLLAKCLLAASLVLVLWALNFTFPLVAISVGALILLIGRVKSGFIHDRIDWTLLLFFAALFVLIEGFDLSGAPSYLIQHFEPWFHRGPLAQLVGLSGAMLVLSNLVSNVPAVLLFRPLVPSFANQHVVWLTLAVTSTFAGNCTPLSSIANLIVLQQANKQMTISFWDFTRVGLVVTFVTTAAAVALLALEGRLFPGI
jgi:Na+/H+ antiporter NhaD/arsenite permease-like protein